eukprot:TRINITY_DN25327_c0_g2_i3.p1 TRINITY_DN25327_c0_g2~~TRINITY_DN25327_c0_g2_i3.p1  ORF type:complete len:1222 (+),score=355.35 TRINITY_DN25327_c0_g2_i3:171-3836(+)
MDVGGTIGQISACFCSRKADTNNTLRDADEEEALWTLQAPVDDDAAINLLVDRGFAEALEGEWPESDEGWLDRLCIGKISRGPNERNRTVGDFLGFILATNPANVSDVTDCKPRNSAVEGQVMWTGWLSHYPAVKVDCLHLLPLSGPGDQPIESMNLAKLSAAPTLQAIEGEEDKLSLMLDFGISVDALVITGHPQAERWVNVIKAALLSSMTGGGADIEDGTLSEVLQKYDRSSDKKHADEAHSSQHRIIEDFAKSQAEDEEAAFDPFNEDDVLPYESHLQDKVELVLESNEFQVDVCCLLEALEKVAGLPRMLVTAATRVEPPRHDILDFWQEHHHYRLCESLNHVWKLRQSDMTAVELADLGRLLDNYRDWMESTFIEDPSFHISISEISDVYGRRVAPSLVSLAQNVADITTVGRAGPDGTGAMCTSAPIDMLTFLGPVAEVALNGAEEMRNQAAKVLDSALLKYKKRLKERLRVVEESENSALLTVYVAALLTDAEAFAAQLRRLLSEVTGDVHLSGGVFCTVESRFREAAEVYCERLVQTAMLKTGAATAFGVPPTANNVVQTDLKHLVREVLVPAMKGFQNMLEEPWRSRFAVRMLTRLVAFELYTLLFCKKTGSPTAQQIAEKLQGHRAELAAAARVWVAEEQIKFAENRVNALADVAALLTAPAAKLEFVVQGVKQIHASSFTQDVVELIFTLRPELDEEIRKKACSRAEPPRSTVKQRQSARKSYFAIADMTISRKGNSVFDWVKEHEWADKLAAALQATDLRAPAWEPAWLEKGETDLRLSMDELEEAQAANRVKRSKKEKEDTAPSIDDFLSVLDDLEEGDEDDGDGSHTSHTSSEEEDSSPPGQARAKMKKADSGRGLEDEKGDGEDGGKSEEGVRHSYRPKTDRDVDCDSNGWSDSSFEGSDDEEGKDADNMRGWLFMKANFRSKVGADGDGERAIGFIDQVRTKVVKVVDEAVNGAQQVAPADWEMRLFMVEKDSRKNRVVRWYRDWTDATALGTLLVSQIGEVTASEEPGHKTAQYAIKLEIKDEKGAVERVLELRSKHESEHKMWMAALAVLKERQSQSFVMVKTRNEPVRRLEPHLNIRDPEDKRDAGNVFIQTMNMKSMGKFRNLLGKSAQAAGVRASVLHSAALLQPPGAAAGEGASSSVGQRRSRATNLLTPSGRKSVMQGVATAASDAVSAAGVTASDARKSLMSFLTLDDDGEIQMGA